MPGPKPKPVTIRGVTYPSASAAANALGLKVQTVRIARTRGKLENVGLGSGSQTEAKLPKGPFNIGKYKFENRRQASLALGHKGNYISNILSLNIPSQMRRLAKKMVEYERKRDEEEKSK